MKAGMSAPGTKPTKSLVVLMSASDPKRTSSRIHPDRNSGIFILVSPTLSFLDCVAILPPIAAPPVIA